MNNQIAAHHHGSSTQTSAIGMTREKRNRLLLVAPGEQVIGGASASTRILQKIVATMPTVEIDRIDSAPPARRYGNKRSLITSETINRSITVIRNYLRKIRQTDAVLLYTNNQFTFALGPLMWIVAKMFGKRIYLKPVGGDLDLDIQTLSFALRIPVLTMLRHLDGIMAQTQLLQQALTKLGCPRVYYIPNWRMPTDVTETERAHTRCASNMLNLVYLSQVHEDKGVFVLLEALRELVQEDDPWVHCDFYGPIFPEIRDRFLQEIDRTPNAQYFDVVPFAEVHTVLAAYDALVLPTHYIREGHPGIIVEAIQLGLPIISTNHRAIPELVQDGVNGLLVPPNDPAALATAIRNIRDDAGLRQQMAEASYAKGEEFDANNIVPVLLKIIFPEMHEQVKTSETGLGIEP